MAHAEAMWQICQHSKGTVNKGLHVDPSGLHVSFDCFVNADCAGNWNLPEAEDPNMVKSQCGCIVTPGNIPVLWKSKWIQEICLSAMESKCISLSMAAHSLICIPSSASVVFCLSQIESVDLVLGTRSQPFPLSLKATCLR